MKMYFILSFLLLTSTLALGQTKNECVLFLKTVDRKMEKSFWINTTLNGKVLVRERYDDEKYGENQYPIEKETIDLSKVESVVVEYNEKFQSYYVNAYLKGNYYKRTNTHSEAFTVNVNWFNYYGFKDKKEAEKIQNILIKLCKYCGSNPLKY